MKNHIDDENPYAKLGITPIINAIGSVTMLGLSLIHISEPTRPY